MLARKGETSLLSSLTRSGYNQYNLSSTFGCVAGYRCGRAKKSRVSTLLERNARHPVQILNTSCESYYEVPH